MVKNERHVPQVDRGIQNATLRAIVDPSYSPTLPRILASTWDRILTGTRKSQVDTNERLEYVGDALVYVCVALDLMEKYPDALPGFLTRIRQVMVTNLTLSLIVEKIDPRAAKRGSVLQPLKRYCEDDKRQYTGQSLQQRVKLSISSSVVKGAADCMESAIGALFYEQGFQAVRDWCSDTFAFLIPFAVSSFNKSMESPAKSVLQKRKAEDASSSQPRAKKTRKAKEAAEKAIAEHIIAKKKKKSKRKRSPTSAGRAQGLVTPHPSRSAAQPQDVIVIDLTADSDDESDSEEDDDAERDDGPIVIDLTGDDDEDGGIDGRQGFHRPGFMGPDEVSGVQADGGTVLHVRRSSASDQAYVRDEEYVNESKSDISIDKAPHGRENGSYMDADPFLVSSHPTLSSARLSLEEVYNSMHEQVDGSLSIAPSGQSKGKGKALALASGSGKSSGLGAPPTQNNAPPQASAPAHTTSAISTTLDDAVSASADDSHGSRYTGRQSHGDSHRTAPSDTLNGVSQQLRSSLAAQLGSASSSSTEDDSDMEIPGLSRTDSLTDNTLGASRFPLQSKRGAKSNSSHTGFAGHSVDESPEHTRVEEDSIDDDELYDSEPSQPRSNKPSLRYFDCPETLSEDDSEDEDEDAVSELMIYSTSDPELSMQSSD